MQHHALLHGDGRSAIVRNGRGEPSELILMRPDAWAIVVEPGRTIAGQNVPARKWHVRIDDPEARIADADCLHIMGLSDDGFAGLGVIEAAKQALGLAIAQQTRAVMSEKNGARLKFLLKAPPGAFRNEQDAKAFIDRFNEFHSGSENADKVGLIREGLAVEQISQTNSEAEVFSAGYRAAVLCRTDARRRFERELQLARNEEPGLHQQLPATLDGAMGGRVRGKAADVNSIR
jgi:phage portal protein BeeE